MSDRIRAAGAAVALSVAALCAGGAVVLGAVPIDCDAPNLDAVEAQLTIARVHGMAGDSDGVRAAIDAARAELDAIARTCWGPVPSPEPSIPIVTLGGSRTIGGRALSYPADLVELEDGLLRPVDDGGLRADVLTLGDSIAAAEVIGSDLDEPVPPGFRVISLAVGDPSAVLATVGTTDPEAETPTDPVRALGQLVEAIDVDDIDFGDVGPFVFPDGASGAAADFTGLGEDRAVLLDGSFLVRPMPDGDWALGVALAAPGGMDRLRAELAATLLSIGPEG